MTQLILLDHAIEKVQFNKYFHDSFVTVKGYFPMEMAAEFDVTFYDSLQDAVKVSDSIFIHVPEAQWDNLLLGENGILVSIREGTEIINAVPLSDERSYMYDVFLTAKNQVFIHIT